MRYFQNSINRGLRPRTPKAPAVLSGASANLGAPGVATPGPPLGVIKEPRADVAAGVRRGAVRVEVQQPSVRPVAVVTTHHENPPAGAGVHGPSPRRTAQAVPE